jgi:hypothetical protein
VISWFQSLCFNKFNLYSYTSALASVRSDPKSPGGSKLSSGGDRGVGKGKGGFGKGKMLPSGDDGGGGAGAGGNGRSGGAGGGGGNGNGDLASAVGAGPLGAARKGGFRRPPALSLSEPPAPYAALEAGTPLLSGGAVVGEVPGLRASARGGAGQSLRKAVLEKWGAPTPADQSGAVATPMTTGATPGASMDPLAFLTTPRDEGAMTPSLFGKGAGGAGGGGTPAGAGAGGGGTPGGGVRTPGGSRKKK